MADHGFSERRACRLIGVNRSAWQYEPLRGKDDAVRERQFVAAAKYRSIQRKRGIETDELALMHQCNALQRHVFPAKFGHALEDLK